jgi:protease I
MITIVFVIAHSGFQPIEYSIPTQILRDAGFAIVTASNKAGKATSSMGDKVDVDITLDQIDPKTYDALFFVGGPGALENLDNAKSYKLIKTWAASGKPFGAICIAPRILAKAGVLKQKKATGWDDDQELADVFKKYDVHYIRKAVVVDGNIVTAIGPRAAEEFGNTIAHVLGMKQPSQRN